MQEKPVALLSVHNKDGIVEFARGLVDLGWELLASSGTYRAIDAGGVPVQDVAPITGWTPILGHRVVTLHPRIFGGVLSKRIPEHDAELEAHRIPRISLVCIDLYPFREEVERFRSGEATHEQVLDKIDIGGAALLAAAAKNELIVICDPDDRKGALRWLKTSPGESDRMRRRLSGKALAVVADYYLAVAEHMGEGEYTGIIGEKVRDLAYGENRWQSPAALYRTLGRKPDPLSIEHFRQIAGNPQGYINVTDQDRALITMLKIMAGFEVNLKQLRLACVGVKHGNACGAAVGSDPKNYLDVVKRMVEGSPGDLLGGTVIANFVIDEEAAKVLRFHKWDGGGKGRPLDAIIAPTLTPEALEVFGRQDNRCRVLVNQELHPGCVQRLDLNRMFRQVRGGFLTQGPCDFVLDLGAPYMEVSGGELREEWKPALILAWAVGSTSNSNTVALAGWEEGGPENCYILANAVGQQSRVECAKLAVDKAGGLGHEVDESVAYSDSFFPSSDAVHILVNHCVRCILASKKGIHFEEVKAAGTASGGTLVTAPDEIIRGFFGH